MNNLTTGTAREGGRRIPSGDRLCTCSHAKGTDVQTSHSEPGLGREPGTETKPKGGIAHRDMLSAFFSRPVGQCRLGRAHGDLEL